ncbi:MAG TPA: hypothetical protein VJ824_09100 [Bacillota bacterium]|nr:hypothetical protein [Bacillota bacterium]
MNKLMTLSAELKKILRDQPSQHTAKFTEWNQHLSTISRTDQVRQAKAQIAQAEAFIQDAMIQMELEGNEELIANLDRIHSELMNYSQSLERQEEGA